MLDDAEFAGPLVDVRNIRHFYRKGGGADLLVLDDVNLELKDNEIVGLLGRSGSGKSTLLRAIAGLLRPTAGTVSSSADIAREAARLLSDPEAARAAGAAAARGAATLSGAVRRTTEVARTLLDARA